MNCWTSLTAGDGSSKVVDAGSVPGKGGHLPGLHELLLGEHLSLGDELLGSHGSSELLRSHGLGRLSLSSAGNSLAQVVDAATGPDSGNRSGELLGGNRSGKLLGSDGNGSGNGIVSVDDSQGQSVQLRLFVDVGKSFDLDALSLEIINRNNAVAAPVATPVAAPVAVAPQQFAAPVAPQQFAAPVAGVWTGSCINNLGQGVPCRAEAQPAQAVAPQQFAAPVAPKQFIPQAQVFSQQQFVQPRQVAALPWNGACINNLGAAVPCSQ